MGAVIRIVMRYAIGTALGWTASKGLIPDSLAAELSTSEEVINAIQLGVCAGAGVCVERFYFIAKRNGWSL